MIEYKGQTETGVQYVAHQSPHLVTFCDESMRRSAQLCVESSKKHGVGTHARFTPGHVSTWSEVKAHPEIFRQPEDHRRAWSWWAFKPLIIAKELTWLPDDSICIYSDAGIEFLDNVNYIIDRMKDDTWLFGNMYEHAHWCKRDVIEAIWPLSLDDMKADSATDDDNLRFGDWWQQRGWSRFGKQVQASVIVFRVNDHTREFVREWLDWCLFEGGRLIDDSPSRTPNHPEFQENRHDQAILTTMAYRDGVPLNWWPASYNEGQFEYPRGDHPGEGYPILFNHHRGVKTGERMA